MFLKKEAAGLGGNGVIRVALVGANGVEETLDLNTAGAYVYAEVDKDGGSSKIVVTTADTNTTPTGITLTVTGTNFKTTPEKTDGAVGSGIITWTYAQDSTGTAIAIDYVTISITLS